MFYGQKKLNNENLGNTDALIHCRMLSEDKRKPKIDGNEVAFCDHCMIIQ